MNKQILESVYEDIYNTDYSNTDIIESQIAEDIDLDDNSDELDDDFFVPELIFPGNDEVGEA